MINKKNKCDLSIKYYANILTRYVHRVSDLIKNVESVTYSSQGSHAVQLDLWKWLTDDSKTG